MLKNIASGQRLSNLPRLHRHRGELMLPASPQYLVLWARREKHQLPGAFPHLAQLLGASRLGSHSHLDGTAWGESFHLNFPIKWAAGEGPERTPLARRHTQPSALLRRQLPLLPASRENRQTSCHPAPFPSRLALKIKNSFHLSRPRERTREKEVCCQYMELSLSEGEKKYGGEGGETREGTKPHFYFWWPAS